MKQEKCLNPQCSRYGAIRGLCHSCYQSVRFLVTKNVTTWERLEKEGKVKKVIRGSGSPVREWILSNKTK